jgi:hypothetical protein
MKDWEVRGSKEKVSSLTWQKVLLSDPPEKVEKQAQSLQKKAIGEGYDTVFVLRVLLQDLSSV